MTRVTGGNEAIATHQTLRTSMKAARSSCGRYRAKVVVVFGTVLATERGTATDRRYPTSFRKDRCHGHDDRWDMNIFATNRKAQAPRSILLGKLFPLPHWMDCRDSLEWPKEINPMTLSLDYDITPQSFRGGSWFPFRNLHSPHDVIKKNVGTLRNS